MPEDPQTTNTPSATSRSRSAVGWVLAPATEEVPRHQAVGATILRIMLGFLWLWNINWKVPPDFGEAGKQGLYKFTRIRRERPGVASVQLRGGEVVSTQPRDLRVGGDRRGDGAGSAHPLRRLDPGCGTPGEARAWPSGCRSRTRQMSGRGHTC